MEVADESGTGPDPLIVRRGSHAVHRTAGLVFGFGVLGYSWLTVAMLAMYVIDRDQALFAPTMTLSLDTALALLGLCATVLIALVASLWASGQLADANLSRGRRRAFSAVTMGTGAGSVIVGTAGALHRPDEGWNFITVTVLFGLGLVLAYITVDVAFIIQEDHSLDQALRRHDTGDRRTRLRTARRNWLRQTRSARWTRRRRRPTPARLRQTVVLLVWLVVVLTAALAALGGRRAITGYLGWWFLDVAVGVLVGQLAAHFLAITFIARRWEPFYWYCMFAILYLPLSSLAQLELLASMEDELPDGVPGVVGGLTLGLACCLGPFLLCLLGLTVSPRRWRRFRPMTQIRWSVISAIGREIELVDKVSIDTDTDSPKRHSLVSRLMLAIRRTNGTEEIVSGDA